jgi:MFS family permease
MYGSYLRIGGNKGMKNKSFIFYVTGQAVSVLGDGVYQIAIMWLIMKITNNKGLAVGGAFSIFSIGELISGFISGPIADRFNKKRLLIITDFLRAVVLFTLYFLSVKNLVNMYMIVLILLVLSILSPVFSTTQFTLMPLLVESDELLKANGIFNSFTTISRILGPALGGVLVGAFGYNACFLIDAISFLVSVATIAFIRYKPIKVENIENKTVVSILKSFKEGYKYLLSSKFLITLSIYALFLNFIGGALLPLIPIFANRFHFGSQGYGYMMSAFSLGFLAFSLLVGLLPKELPETCLMLYGLTVGSTSIILWGASKSLILVLILFFIFGFSNALTNLPLNTLLQKMIKIEFLGVVISFTSTISQALQPVSMAFSGYLADKIPISMLIIFIGISSLTISLIGFVIPVFKTQQNNENL